jgi:predicted enzyme related to lactoylglutathione lyase
VHTPSDLSQLTPEPAAPGVGEMSWHELYAADLQPAFAFYTRLFGWAEQQSMDMGPMGPYVIFGRGDKMYGGMMKRASDDMPVAWNVYVRVPGLDAALTAVRANGGQVIMGPQEVPGGDVVALCLDPHGGTFGLHEVRGGARA